MNDRHFIHRLLHSDGQQYALGLRANTSSEYPTLWFVDKDGHTQYVAAASLVSLHTYPAKRGSPSMRLWSTERSSPVAARFQITYASAIYVKDVFALSKDYAREKALRWFALQVGKSHKSIHDWVTANPHNFKELT